MSLKFFYALFFSSISLAATRQEKKRTSLFFLSPDDVFIFTSFVHVFFSSLFSYLFHFKDMSVVRDIIIIGGGIVGLGVFRQLLLNGYRNVLLLEKSSQIITGASSGNSGILHTGFDTVPQTLESTLVKRGYALYQSFAQDIQLPIKKIGAYIIAWKSEELEILKQILDTAHEVSSFSKFIIEMTVIIHEFSFIGNEKNDSAIPINFVKIFYRRKK